MASALIFILLAGTISFYYYVTRNFNYWKKRNIKGPKPVPLFGNVKDGALGRKTYNEVYQKIHEQFPNEKVVGFYQMTSPCLMIRDPDIIKKILIKDFDNFITRGMKLNKEDGAATLFQCDAITWKALRSKYNPMFTSGKLKSMVPSIVEASDKFIKYLDKEIDKNAEIKTHIAFKRYTIAAIAASSFTLDMPPDDEKTHKRLAVIDKAIFDWNIFYEINMMFPSFLKTFNITVFPSIVSEFYDEITNKLLKERNGKESDNHDFMDILINLKNKGSITVNNRGNKEKEETLTINDRILGAQTFQYFGAGYETSATGLSVLCYCLATHPEVKENVVKEIETKLKEHNNVFSYEFLKDLNYLDNALAEALRMYPMLEPIQRMAEEDYYIPEVDLTIQKDQIVLVSASGLHYDEQYYPEPHKYKPERFDDPKLKEIMNVVYLPFGAGPRHCVGLRLGKLQTKVLIAKLLMKYDIVPSEKTTIPLRFRPYTLMLTPENGLPLKFVPRSKTK